MDYKIARLINDAFDRQMIKLCVDAFEGDVVNTAAIFKMQALFDSDQEIFSYLQRIRQAYSAYSLQTRKNCIDIQELALALNHYSQFDAPPSVFTAIINGGGPFWALGVRDGYNPKHVQQVLKNKMGMPDFRAASVAGESYSQVWSPEEQKRNNETNDPVGGHHANELHNIGLRITWNEPEGE